MDGNKALRSPNLILASIAPEDLERFSGLLEDYPLQMRQMLHQAGEEFEWIYFPTRGIISILTVLENGMMVEFATVGREGTTGIPLTVDLADSMIAMVSQMPGNAMRMRAADFMREIKRSPSFGDAVTCYAGVMFALLAQSAACNRAHHVEERCARWLLITHDQAGGDEFPITHEFLSQMLGVSRPSVAGAAAELQRSGLISYHRGEMRIIDREGLERAACECYRVLVRQFDRMRRLCQD